MAIYRKENNALPPKAGLGIIDNILNKFSDHAISNKAVSEEFERISQQLTELSKIKIVPMTHQIGPITTGATSIIDLTSFLASYPSGTNIIGVIRGFIQGNNNVDINGLVVQRNATSLLYVAGATNDQACYIGYSVVLQLPSN